MSGKRIYNHEDGGMIIVTKEEFDGIPLEDQSKFTLADRIPSKEEVEEYTRFNKFRAAIQSIINKLEETSARPAVTTKKGNPIRWRYSSQDIANVVGWITTAQSERIKELEDEIKRLKGETVEENKAEENSKEATAKDSDADSNGESATEAQ